MVSRAIHLEVASSLETDTCINALQHFISRWGQVEDLRLDNGADFIGVERELKEFEPGQDSRSSVAGWNLLEF